jgi:hypothetical protein
MAPITGCSYTLITILRVQYRQTKMLNRKIIIFVLIDLEIGLIISEYKLFGKLIVIIKNKINLRS